MEELSFSVPGMTCGHCVAAVRGEIEKVPGVSVVSVDLETKAVVVTGTDIRVDGGFRQARLRTGLRSRQERASLQYFVDTKNR
jgi:copper chaperone CopZ